MYYYILHYSNTCNAECSRSKDMGFLDCEKWMATLNKPDAVISTTALCKSQSECQDDSAEPSLTSSKTSLHFIITLGWLFRNVNSGDIQTSQWWQSSFLQRKRKKNRLFKTKSMFVFKLMKPWQSFSPPEKCALAPFQVPTNL